MRVRGGAGVLFVAVTAATLSLGGCASSGITTGGIADPNAQVVTPVDDTPVQSSNLPAIGSDGAVQVADSGPMQLDQPAPLSAAPPQQPMTLDQPGQPEATVSSAQPATTGAPNAFVSLNSVGTIPDTPGRDLSDGLSYDKLLGGWTIVSGAEQCKLNLTYTEKTGTDRYRASSPNCSLDALAAVASWALVGNQVQLYDEDGSIVATLIQAGNRFIGTLSGGRGISMVG